MDFLDPKKRRTHTIRLFIGYGLVGIALLIGTGILALYAYGFDFNRKTRTIIQNGLVFVDSHPETADIYLNGESKGKTSARLVIPEGQYSLELRRKGYRTWKKDFRLEGSQLERIVYPFLFPEKLITKDIQLYDEAPSFASESPDRRWLIIQKNGSPINQYELIDLTTTTNLSTPLSLPVTLFTVAPGAHKIELSEWSTDNRRLVVRHTYTGGAEYVLIDRESPASSQNLTRFFGLPLSRITLRDKKYDQYYVYDSTSLVLATAELSAKTITPLINGVLAFKSHGTDTILYKTSQGAAVGKDLLMLRSGSETYALRELPHSDKHLVDIARFDGRWYMVAASPVEGRTYVFRDPQSAIKRAPNQKPAPVAALRLEDPMFVSFSTNARFVVVQSSNQFAVYDSEDIRLLHYDTKLKVAASEEAIWMDGHRLTQFSDGKLYVFDFDGGNSQALNSVSPNQRAFFDKDYKVLFSIGPSAVTVDRTALRRSELINR